MEIVTKYKVLYKGIYTYYIKLNIMKETDYDYICLNDNGKTGRITKRILRGCIVDTEHDAINKCIEKITEFTNLSRMHITELNNRISDAETKIEKFKNQLEVTNNE